MQRVIAQCLHCVCFEFGVLVLALIALTALPASATPAVVSSAAFSAVSHQRALQENLPAQAFIDLHYGGQRAAKWGFQAKLLRRFAVTINEWRGPSGTDARQAGQPYSKGHKQSNLSNM